MSKYAFTTKLNSNSRKGILGKLKNFCCGGNLLLNFGIPSKAFHFGGGLGDHLLCTALFHELGKRGIQQCWMLSHYPEIFQNSPYGLQVVPDDWKTIKLLEKIKTYLKGTSIRLADNVPAHTGYTINQTLEKVDQTLSILSHSIEEMESPILRIKKKAAMKLDQIQKLIAPDMKDNYLGERLKQIVNIEIKQRLKDEDLQYYLYESLHKEINVEEWVKFNDHLKNQN